MKFKIINKTWDFLHFKPINLEQNLAKLKVNLDHQPSRQKPTELEFKNCLAKIMGWLSKLEMLKKISDYRLDNYQKFKDNSEMYVDKTKNWRKKLPSMKLRFENLQPKAKIRWKYWCNNAKDWTLLWKRKILKLELSGDKFKNIKKI